MDRCRPSCAFLDNLPKHPTIGWGCLNGTKDEEEIAEERVGRWIPGQP